MAGPICCNVAQNRPSHYQTLEKMVVGAPSQGWIRNPLLLVLGLRRSGPWTGQALCTSPLGTETPVVEAILHMGHFPTRIC
jgi:hypothetical protein